MHGSPVSKKTAGGRFVRFFAAPILNLCIFLIKKLLFFKKRIMYTDIIKKGGA